MQAIEKDSVQVHFNGILLNLTCVAREGSPLNKGRGVILIETAIRSSFLKVSTRKEIESQPNCITELHDQKI